MNADDRAIPNDEEGFLRAIRENPRDDAPRLVYADWLDERGDPRGEFLRLEFQSRQSGQRLESLHAQLDPRWVTAVGPRFRVIFASCHAGKAFEAIFLLRAMANLGIADCKGIVGGAPQPLPETYGWLQAAQIRAVLSRCGEVLLEPSGSE